MPRQAPPGLALLRQRVLSHGSTLMTHDCLLQEKNKAARVTPTNNPDDPFNDEERERLQVEALAKKFEDKYVGGAAFLPNVVQETYVMQLNLLINQIPV